ncbi:hypothetical protein BJ322DRAFT_1110426 [Thelephora terrestris]|uniref:Uncharacterized protein n=1 Tax=Thelephora terrestris TaxID=56493 RepID=A0A9P6HC52_9AGAM|nr:hypothetical protein BJ322DRAFT_1110426 [Thelephora terrestris]
MTLKSTGDSPSIFKDGKLKPGIYKIQNLRSDTYLDIHQYSNEVCCRPAKDLEEGRGLWEIISLGVGYAVKMVEPGKPERFCSPINGTNDATPIFVSDYLVAWRIEIVNEELHRGREYVRFFWGHTHKTWDLPVVSLGENGPKVKLYNNGRNPWQTWRLIPVKVEGTFTPSQVLSGTLGSSSLPPYDGDASGQSSTRAQQAECECNDFGTIVTEVITTRRRYRVEDA